MAEAKGHLIVIEGLDGAGNTTQTQMLRYSLSRIGYKAYSTHQPSEGPAGAIIRMALTRRLTYAASDDTAPRQPIEGKTLALLYAADRLDHLHNDIEPKLAAGVQVICDRYVFSSLAYQGMAADTEWIKALNSKARTADLTIFLEVAAEVSVERIAQGRYGRELYEEQSKLERVWQNYQVAIAEGRAAGMNIVSVDGTQTIQAVHQEVLHATRTMLEAQAKLWNNSDNSLPPSVPF
jgi:dTMP kinase